jgi:hypothetical protein
MIAATDLTFGIEIECTIPAAAFNAAGWIVGAYHVGAPVPGFDGWLAMRDGSVHTQGGRYAVELVSPVLKGEAGFEAVRAMVANLTEMGARVNRSCGFHVHVGFAGNAEALARLVHLTAYAEPALRASTGSPDRDRSRYCRSIKQDYAGLKGAKPASMAEVARLGGARVAYSDARYHVLNLTNLLGGRRPTVEFRAFSGTLNLKKMFAYMQLCLGLTQRAINVTRVAEWDAKPLTAKSAPNCYREGRPGTTEVNRLLAMLGWSRTTDKQYGIVLPETTAASVATLRELAEKYDAARTPRAAAAAVVTPPAAV